MLLIYVLVALFATADGEHHEALGYYANAKACEDARPAAMASLVKSGAVQIGTGCAAVSVAKVS